MARVEGMYGINWGRRVAGEKLGIGVADEAADESGIGSTITPAMGNELEAVVNKSRVNIWYGISRATRSEGAERIKADSSTILVT